MSRRILHDEYFNKAKAEGYRARSAYKLIEICDRFNLIPRGGRVLDLGCSPGAWLQVAAERVGQKGLVVGIDLQETRPGLPPNSVAIQGDVYTDVAALLASALSANSDPSDAAPSRPARVAFDVIISDMAPDTTGHGDDFVSARLCRRVLELAPTLLRPGGNLAMKIFEGADYGEVLREARALFKTTKGFKPKASRDASREMYIIGLGRL